MRPDQLVQANAANSAGNSIARMIGSPLGGIAVAVGGLGTVVVIDKMKSWVMAGSRIRLRFGSVRVGRVRVASAPEQEWGFYVVGEELGNSEVPPAERGVVSVGEGARRATSARRMASARNTALSTRNAIATPTPSALVVAS